MTSTLWAYGARSFFVMGLPCALHDVQQPPFLHPLDATLGQMKLSPDLDKCPLG